MITRGTKSIRAAATPAAGVLLVILLTSCGGEGSIDVPSPSGSITASLPSPTRTPSRSESSTSSESPAESEIPEETSATSTESPSESASPSVPAESAASSSSPPAEDQPNTAEPEDAQSLPAWFWWVLAGLGLLGATLAAIMVQRARRRSRWDTHFAAEQDEVNWLAQELIPGLQQAGSPDAVAGGWQVAMARVTRVEDQLTGLESTAPDEGRGRRARSLRDAVRTARQGIEHLIVSRDPATLSHDLAAIRHRLHAAINASEPTR